MTTARLVQIWLRAAQLAYEALDAGDEQLARHWHAEAAYWRRLAFRRLSTQLLAAVGLAVVVALALR